MTGLSDELNRLNTEEWSNRDIERIAERHGHKLHNSTVSNYLAGRHAKPTTRVLEAFAAVFGVDVNQLRGAAGLPPSGEPFDLGPDSARLTGAQREAIRTTVRLFVEQNDALANRPQPDGSTTGLIDTSLGRSDADANAYHRQWGSKNEGPARVDWDRIEPRRADYDRAADDSGPSLLEADDARAARRGEESQDPGSDEPA